MFCIILCQTALTHSWPDNWLSSLPGNGNKWPRMGGSGTIHNNKSWLAETKPAYITPSPTSSVHVDIHAAQQPGHCSNAAGERVNKTGLHVIILTWHHGMTRPRRPVPVVGPTVVVLLGLVRRAPTGHHRTGPRPIRAARKYGLNGGRPPPASPRWVRCRPNIRGQAVR